MKRSFLCSAVLTALCAIVCMLGVRLLPKSPNATPPQIITHSSASEEPAPQRYDDRTLTVLMPDGPAQVSLHDYLIGVLLAEIPASFAPEARKAQAVAARTFTLKRLEGDKHNGAVCTDSTCCQAWTAPEDADTEALAAMTEAVEQTDGYVVEYQGMLIDAVFFSCSGGKTEAAVEVWGNDIPYLQAVDSLGEEDAAPYSDTLDVSEEDFRQTISTLCPDADLSGPKSGWLGKVTYTVGGGVDTIGIGGANLTGLSLRSAFSLRSTQFTLEPTEDGFRFHTLGYGHRVGMSQYGANAMAEDGADFVKILQHYYQGVDIVRRAP